MSALIRGPIVGIVQAGDEVLLRAFAVLRSARPWRAATCSTGDVRVLVGGHVHALLAAVLDERDGVGRLAPRRLARRLDVRDVDAAAAAAADRDGLLDGGEESARFVADVAGVEAAVLARDLGQGDDLVGLRRRCRDCR